MTLKGGTSQACAACKYQRRRCTSECPLAPYFPPDQPKLFQNAHKLFGVSNILKILKKLEPEQKAIAMWSIIYQANERERDPVHGCLGKICQLRYQIWHMEQELLSIHSHLEMLRQQQHQQQQQVIPSQLELVMGPPTNTVVDTALVHQESYNNNNNDNNNIVYDNALVVEGSSNDINSMWVQYPNYGANNDNNHDNISNDDLMGVQFGIPTLQPLDLIQQNDQVVQNYDEMPFFDTMDDRQSYIDSKEAYDSSSEESVLKETNQTIDHLVDNELKNAAACLSLTSVN